VAQNKIVHLQLILPLKSKIYNKQFDNNSTIVIQRGIFELTSQPVLADAAIKFCNTLQMGNFMVLPLFHSLSDMTLAIYSVIK